MTDLSRLKVTTSPHIHTSDNTSQIMLDVIIALIPALVVSVMVFGFRALILTCIAVVSCVSFEALYCLLLKKQVPVKDLSAVVTGILLAYCLPVSAPWWMFVIGSAFAIIVVKQLYGGIGKNFMNPALTARAFLLASWPLIMTTWTAPKTSLPLIASIPDAVSSATPMSYISNGVVPEASATDMLLGMVGGSLGETSALALLAGGVYLVYRKVITIRIPVAYLGTVALLTLAFPLGEISNVDNMIYHLLSGGVMLCAIFMASDYTTSPVTKWGQVIYGIGCGALTVFIRYFSAYPEGSTYAVLIMNILVPLIEKATSPRKFGFVKKSKKEVVAK